MARHYLAVATGLPPWLLGLTTRLAVQRALGRIRRDLGAAGSAADLGRVDPIASAARVTAARLPRLRRSRRARAAALREAPRGGLPEGSSCGVRPAPATATTRRGRDRAAAGVRAKVDGLLRGESPEPSEGSRPSSSDPPSSPSTARTRRSRRGRGCGAPSRSCAASTSARAKASIAASPGASSRAGTSGPRSAGSALTFTSMPRRSRGELARVLRESLTPAIRTYSAVRRRWDSSGQRRIAARTPASGYVRVIGMSRVARLLVGGVDRHGEVRPPRSAANRAKPGVMPDVETVTRRGEMVSKRISSAPSTPSGFRNGSPIPMKTTRRPSVAAADVVLRRRRAGRGSRRP